MRRRPEIEIRFQPRVVYPGQLLEVQALFRSRSHTPIDWVDFRLTGYELALMGAGRYSWYERHNYVGLGSRWTPTAFAPGQHRQAVRFGIPANAPPSYAGKRGRVEYELEVHVSIPWWPDLVRRYIVPVVLAPVAPPGREARVFTSSTAGPQGTELYAEASLDRVAIEPGGTLTGALSFANARHARVRGVGVAFVSTEVVRSRRGASYLERVHRFDARVFDGCPADGVELPFRVQVPAALQPEFVSLFNTFGWMLEVYVVGGWDERTVLSIPVAVLPPTGRSSESLAPLLPAVGRERRAQLWAQVAQRTGLLYDPERETMRGVFGGVALTVAPEQRGTDGLYTVAQLAWEDLALGLDVGPAQWSDAFSRAEIDFGEASFDLRFHVRGRVPEQVRALLSPGVRQMLWAFGEVTMGDTGARLSQRGSATDVATLGRFVSAAIATARALEESARALPVPPSMAPHADAWRTFAARLQGRFEPGRVWIHGGTHGLEHVALGCRWSSAGEFEATVLSVALEPPLERSFDLADDASALPAAARALAQELAREAAHLTLGPDAVLLELRDPVPDPSALGPLIDRMARLARALRGRGEAGPFR